MPAEKTCLVRGNLLNKRCFSHCCVRRKRCVKMSASWGCCHVCLMVMPGYLECSQAWSVLLLKLSRNRRSARNITSVCFLRREDLLRTSRCLAGIFRPGSLFWREPSHSSFPIHFQRCRLFLSP